MKHVVRAGLALAVLGSSVSPASSFILNNLLGWGYTQAASSNGTQYAAPSSCSYNDNGDAAVLTTYLTAGGQQARDLVTQLAQLYPNWSFGTGPALSGELYVDRLQMFITDTVPGPYLGLAAQARCKQGIDSPAYPGLPNHIYDRLVHGVAGTLTLQPDQLRWIERVVSSPIPAPYINHDPNTNDTSVPFYWSESTDPLMTNISVWLARVQLYQSCQKYIGPLVVRPIPPPGTLNDHIVKTTRVDTFLVQYIPGIVPTVIVYDGFQMNYTSNW